MRHDLTVYGRRFALRPVSLADAAFILSLRGDTRLNHFINETSPDLEDQQAWIDRYFDRPGDWYFIVINVDEGAPEGAVGIYDFNLQAGTAEWGRWILRSGSLAAVESAMLVYEAAFEKLGLRSVYCRTVASNKAVASFHDSSGARRSRVLHDHVTIRGQSFDMIEHSVDRDLWSQMRPKLERLAVRLAGRRTGSD